jgi:integrase
MAGPLAGILREHLVRTGRRKGFLFGPSAADVAWVGQWGPVLRRAYTRWGRAGETRIAFHECRHTYASWIIAAAARSGEYVDIAVLVDRRRLHPPPGPLSAPKRPTADSP